MTPGIFIAAFFCYALLVFVSKRMSCPTSEEQPRPYLHAWQQGHEYTLLVSQDFWWAKRFKCRIKQFEPENTIEKSLGIYVKNNNLLNFWLSLTLTIFLFCAHARWHESLFLKLLLAVAIFRFISRSFEITYAFGCDVLQKSASTTGLNKLERIKLALVSYSEIFFYSAAAYLVLPSINSPLEAITLSLNVGTLTNVGFAFPDRNALLCYNMAFIQVVTTLSLVVLSLASYLSREESAHCLTSGSNRSLRSLGRAKARPLTKR